MPAWCLVNTSAKFDQHFPQKVFELKLSHIHILQFPQKAFEFPRETQISSISPDGLWGPKMVAILGEVLFFWRSSTRGVVRFPDPLPEEDFWSQTGNLSTRGAKFPYQSLSRELLLKSPTWGLVCEGIPDSMRLCQGIKGSVFVAILLDGDRGSWSLRIIFCKDVRISRGIRRSDVGTKISWLHLKHSRQKDKDWSEMNGLVLVSIVAYFLCCGHICSSFCFTLCCSELTGQDILTTNPLKPRSQIPQYVELTKRFLKKKRKKSAQLGERSSWILWDISFLEIVLWDSDWDPKIALFPQYCI